MTSQELIQLATSLAMRQYATYGFMIPTPQIKYLLREALILAQEEKKR